MSKKKIIKFNAESVLIDGKQVSEYILNENDSCLDDRYYTESEVDKIIDQAGTVKMFAGNTIPEGWLLCDGSAISRTTYANLFNAIGTTWGAGNGSTTFNLPNTIDRVVQGYSTSGGYRNAGLPNITGYKCWGGVSTNWSTYSGAIYATKQGSGYTWFGANQYYGYDLYFNAARCSSIYGNSSTVQPPALTMRFIIKY